MNFIYKLREIQRSERVLDIKWARNNELRSSRGSNKVCYRAPAE